MRKREREVLHYLMRGWTSARIGAELGISHETVDNHVHRILVESGCRTRLELVCKLWARECARLKRLVPADQRAA